VQEGLSMNPGWLYTKIFVQQKWVALGDKRYSTRFQEYDFTARFTELAVPLWLSWLTSKNTFFIVRFNNRLDQVRATGKCKAPEFLINQVLRLRAIMKKLL
jgi:hypothetical protein